MSRSSRKRSSERGTITFGCDQRAAFSFAQVFAICQSTLSFAPRCSTSCRCFQRSTSVPGKSALAMEEAALDQDLAEAEVRFLAQPRSEPECFRPTSLDWGPRDRLRNRRSLHSSILSPVLLRLLFGLELDHGFLAGCDFFCRAYADAGGVRTPQTIHL